MDYHAINEAWGIATDKKLRAGAHKHCLRGIEKLKHELVLRH